MKLYSVKGANIVVGGRRYMFAPFVLREIPDETAQYLLGTGNFFKEGEKPTSEIEADNKPINIGVYRIGGFGDGLLGTCVIRAISRKYPKARIQAHTYGNIRPVWEGMPEIYSFSSQPRPRMNNTPYVVSGHDIFFDLMPDCYAWYRKGSHAADVACYTQARAEIDRYKRFPNCVNHLNPFCTEKNFEALDVYNFLFGTDATVKDMYIRQNPLEREAVQLFKKRGLLPPNGRYITIHDWAFNGRQTKSWFPAYWKELGNLLRGKFNVPLVQLGGAGEESLYADYDLRGKTTFGESAEILRHSLLHIDNESTPAHVCPAIGTPCVCVCGATLKYWRHKENINITSAHPCQECEGHPDWYKKCKDNHSFGCMKNITPQLVFDTILSTPRAQERL